MSLIDEEKEEGLLNNEDVELQKVSKNYYIK